MRRMVGRLGLVAAAAVAGYLAGSRNGNVVEAARDPAREILEADREFDAATARDGIEGWIGTFAPDGIMMPGGHEMVVGQPAIREFASKAFGAPGFAMRWEPVDSEACGDLGYSYGVSKMTHTGADGKPAVSYGKYVTIWRRQRDKSWKVAVDIGNASPRPEPKPQ